MDSNNTDYELSFISNIV